MKYKVIAMLISLLVLDQSSLGQNLTNEQAQQIKSLAHDISVDSSYRNGNWDAVVKAVENKDIVLLGEPNHGSKEIFITRNELIKKLHQKLGFDVILFESGIGEVGAIEVQKDSLSGEQMTYGFFGAWRTQAFRDLMEYVKKNSLSIGGFDVQKTGNNFGLLLEKQSRSNSIDSTLYHNLEERFNQQKSLLTNRNAVYDSLKHATQELINDYQLLLGKLKEVTRDKKTISGQLVERTIQNRIHYLEYFLEFTRTRNWNKRWKNRDEMMASNVEWFIKNMYKGKKVIIVAHNYHISKFNEKEEVMGEFLVNQYDTKMYVLGVFGGSGSYADNSGREKEMKLIEYDAMDIKKIIITLNGKVHFLDMPKEKNATNAFLFEEMIINDTFIDLSGSNSLIPSQHFDGLLLLDNISPPEK